MRLRLQTIGILAISYGPGAAQPVPVGQLVKAGSRSFHVICAGTGSPAVILIGGVGEFSFDWALTQPFIARGTRVCAWDRAGYAWSDMSPGFEQFPAAAADLHSVILESGTTAPYILVGHAMGALYSRDYQRRFPSEVGGLVLVDPTPEEDFQVQMFGNTVSLIDMADHDLIAWPLRPFAPSHTSPPPARPGTTQKPFDKLPHELQAARQWALRKFFTELDGLNTAQALAVMESERSTCIDLYGDRHVAPLKIPVVVLSRAWETTPAIGAMQDELARISIKTKHRIVEHSGTQIQIEQPDVVASAVMEVVQAVREGT